MSNAEEAAASIHRTLLERGRLEPLAGSLRPESADEGYAIQEALVARLAEERGAIAGFKIALTTAQAQTLMGSSEPCSGVLFEAGVLESGARLAHADFVRATVEAEIAVRIGRDLPSRSTAYEVDEVADRVASWMAAIELVDDTDSDYATTTAADLISWNVWNYGLVLGPPQTDLRALDLSSAAVGMRIGSGAREEGLASDVLGHPLQALTWLANHLSERGVLLREGMVVTTGFIVGPRWPAPGERVLVDVDGLEPVSAFFE